MFYLEVKDMYNKGEFVVKATNGICEIVDVTTMNLSGENKEYYVLVSISEKASKVFVPVATAENKIRPAMKKEDAWKFIKEMSTVEEVLIENEKEREKLYKEAAAAQGAAGAGQPGAEGANADPNVYEADFKDATDDNK